MSPLLINIKVNEFNQNLINSQVLATESLLKMIKNAFYFAIKSYLHS